MITSVQNFFKMGRPKKIKEKSKRIKKQEKLNSLFDFVEKYKPTVVDEDLKKKTAKQKFIQLVKSETSCLRPDIYLDSYRICDKCPLSEYCNCNIKKFSKSFIKK